MGLSTMYPGKNNSPKTTLTADITASDTTITLADASVLAAAPNLAVIGSSTDAEVIIYTSILNNTLSGVTRGVGGTSAKSWTEETVVARNFTMYDYETIRNNILDLDARKMDSADAGELAEKDTVDLSSDVENALPVANGGTGSDTAAGARANLGLGAMSTKANVNLTSDVINVLPVLNGGTGLTASPSMLTNLGSENPVNVLSSDPRPGVTGILSVANGGTGGNSASTARVNLGVTEIAVRPNYIISTSNLVDGQSPLPAGTLYFYYSV